MKLRHEESNHASKPLATGGLTHPRATALGAAIVLVLALAPTASAAFKPLFTATSDSHGVTVTYSQSSGSDGAATLALYAPPTYVAKLPTKVGTAVGTATANAVAADIRGSLVPLDGVIRVSSATQPLVTAGATVGDAARACAGGSASAAFWSLTLKGFNQSIPLAISVQRIDSGPMAGGIALVMCPPPADIPADTTGRAQLGLKIVHLTLKLTNVFTVPSGTHVWHLRATPYAPGSAVANPAGSVEAEAQHGLPSQLTLVAKPATAPRTDVSGRLTVADKGLGGQTVRILAAGKQVGSARTDPSGAFDTTVALGRSRAVVTAKAVVPARYLPACAQPAFAPILCTSSIVAGFSATSARVRAGS